MQSIKWIINNHKRKSIYHWTTTTNSLEIIEDGHLYSKGSLWGMRPDKVNLSDQLYIMMQKKWFY